MKVCSVCEKPFEPRASGRPQKYCTAVCRSRRNNVKSHYGMRMSDVKQMSARQSGRCAICRSEGPLVIDHSHTLRVVRGLLCAACNSGLGHFRDNPSVLRHAARYVEDRQASSSRIFAMTGAS